MSARSWFEAHERSTRRLQILGICIFIAAFFLPACNTVKPVLGDWKPIAGWRCAQITTIWAFKSESYHTLQVLAVIGGLINPLILLYLTFSLSLRFTPIRRVLALTVPVCMAATWVYFFMAPLVPMTGHFLWILGALLILLPEIAPRSRCAD